MEEESRQAEQSLTGSVHRRGGPSFDTAITHLLRMRVRGAGMRASSVLRSPVPRGRVNPDRQPLRIPPRMATVADRLQRLSEVATCGTAPRRDYHYTRWCGFVRHSGFRRNDDRGRFRAMRKE